MKYAIILISLFFELACNMHSETTRSEITPEEASLYVAEIKPWEARLPLLNRHPTLIGGGVIIDDEFLIAAKSVRGNYETLVGRALVWQRLEQTVVEKGRAGSSISYAISYVFDGTSGSRTLHWDSGHYRLE